MRHPCSKEVAEQMVKAYLCVAYQHDGDGAGMYTLVIARSIGESELEVIDLLTLSDKTAEQLREVLEKCRED